MSLINLLRKQGELRVETYRSYGEISAMSFSGRVLASRVVAAATEEEGRRPAIGRMMRRFLTREVAGAEVRVASGNQAVTVVSSSEGYFTAQLDVSHQTGPWVRAMCSIADHHDEDHDDEDHDDEDRDETAWAADSVVVDSQLTRLVMSDVDDTLLANAAGRTLGTIWTTMSGSVLTRLPIDGAPELYRRLAGPDTAVVYVSSSPWNLHSFLSTFLERHGFPRGPLILRDFGLNRATLGSASHGSHKATAITSVLALCPNAQVVLIGDTSQQDPYAFAQLAAERPDQVVAIFLRDVGNADKAAAARRRGHLLGDKHDHIVFEIVASMSDIEPTLRARTAWFDETV